MKKSLLLYLLIIAVLMNIFTYMYFSRKASAEPVVKKDNVAAVRDSLDKATSALADANYFTLMFNQNAQNYFVNSGNVTMSFEELEPHVKNQLLAFNDLPEGNPHTGQTRLGEGKFIINKAQVLNHRWIVADFSDGEYWGEVLLKYFINDDNSISFEVIQSLLYPK